MLEHNISVKLDRFDGPLGLLLQLIQKDEIEVKDLDVNRITKQYLDYLNQLSEINFDIAGDYLYMAATLLYIKSKSVSEDEVDKDALNDITGLEITTKTQLIERLEELERFQGLGEKLWSLPKRDEEIFCRPKVDRKAIQNSILTPIDLNALTGSMMDLMKREKRKYTVVKRDRLSIKEKLSELKARLDAGTNITMDKLINWDKGRDEVVITFISLLELARLKKLEIYQNEDQGSIYVNVKESLNNFDVETADGFEPEGQEEAITADDIAATETLH